MQWSQSNGNAFLTSLHTSYSCCAVKPLLMFGMSSEEVAISSESLSTCVSKTGKSLSSTSLFPSVAYPYQSESTIAPFRSLVICFATAPVTICVVFVWPHWYLFFILESGNMFLNSLAAWYGVLKGKLCSIRQPKKAVQYSLLFGLGLELLNLDQNQLIFFVVMQHPNIYDLRCLCLASIDIIVSSMCNNEVAYKHGT